MLIIIVQMIIKWSLLIILIKNIVYNNTSNKNDNHPSFNFLIYL